MKSMSGKSVRTAAAVLLAASVLSFLPAAPAYAKSLSTHYTRDTRGRYTRISSGVYEQNAAVRRFAAGNGTYVPAGNPDARGEALSQAEGLPEAQGALADLAERYPEQKGWNLYLYDPADDGDAWTFRAAWEADGSSDGTEGNGANPAFSGAADSFPVRIRKDALVHFSFFEDGKTINTALHFLDYARIRRWKVDEAGNLTYALYDRGQMREHFRIRYPVQDAARSVTELSASNRDQNHQ